MENSLIIILIQIILIFLLIAIITFFIMLNDTIKIEKRIARYTIRGSRTKFDKSYYDMVYDSYKYFVKRQRRKINKLFPKLVRRYDKYVTDGEVRAVDYVTHKIVISYLFVILTIITNVLHSKFITLTQFLLSLVFGFYILDIILLISSKFSP